MPIKKTIEVSIPLSKIHCAECGEEIESPVNIYLLECDRCLSKRNE